MAGPIIYLDVDDEITTAAARIRSNEAGRVAVVIPPGSRVATSRMNFRLLAREAASAGKDLAVIAPDAASRALAGSAGLTTFASVQEFEGPPPPATEASEVVPADDTSGKGGGAAAAAAGAAAAGALAAGAVAGRPPAGPADVAAVGDKAAPPVPSGRTPAPASPSGPAGVDTSDRGGPPPAAAAPDVRPRSSAATPAAAGAGRRRGNRTVAVVAAIALLAVAALVVGGVAGYLLLPTATITVTPAVSTVGPVQLTVRADPGATAVDVEAGVVPAQRYSVEVTAEGSYEATGQRVEESKATGRVTFSNCNFLAATEIRAGSRVSTESGVGFSTDETIVVPAATFEPPTSLTCSTRDVAITALAAGPAGNVAAGAITIVPGDQNPRAVQVTNQAATSGGARKTFPVITEADVTRAREDLVLKLGEAFATTLADPATPPGGTTLFAETATLGEATYQPDPAGFVGQETASFDLAARAIGEVTVVDESAIVVVAEDRLADAVDPGHDLVPGSGSVDVGTPTVVGTAVEFPVSTTGQQIARLDPAELELLVLGKTPDEAVIALAPYGSAEVELSPDWAATIPTYEFRVEVIVVGQEPEATPDGEEASPSPGS